MLDLLSSFAAACLFHRLFLSLPACSMCGLVVLTLNRSSSSTDSSMASWLLARRHASGFLRRRRLHPKAPSSRLVLRAFRTSPTTRIIHNPLSQLTSLVLRASRLRSSAGGGRSAFGVTYLPTLLYMAFFFTSALSSMSFVFRLPA